MLFICNKLFPFKVHHNEIVHQSTFLSCRFNALMFKLHEVELKNILYCFLASAETKRDWLIHGHMALDKCNVSLGQQVNNCCPLRPAPYINKQNGCKTGKFINSDFRAFCLKKYTNRQRGYASETKI